MQAGVTTMLSSIWSAAQGEPSDLDAVQVQGRANLPSLFRVADLAAASVGGAGLAVHALLRQAGHAPGPVEVDAALAGRWFSSSIEPEGWTIPPLWNAVAGQYATRDGWIRLHTNAPHHCKVALSVLGCAAEREAVATAVAAWDGQALETAIVEAGGCAAIMRSQAEWAAHPQGRAVRGELLIDIERTGSGTHTWTPDATRPLQGLRVLDLTRVLAGPTASRFLAGFGADVLRIDPPWWDEPGVVPDMTLGKRCAGLDLRNHEDRARFAALLRHADVLLHGYRSDALERLGAGTAWRAAQCPGLVDVSLDAYGWTGPWAARRGFDSLVQMSSGIAHAGMAWAGKPQPVPLPVQALDHATGYLLAMAVVRGLTARLADGQGWRARLSLARTGLLLTDAGEDDHPATPTADDVSPWSPEIEATAWGPARRLRPAVSVGAIGMAWSRAASPLRSAAPSWE